MSSYVIASDRLAKNLMFPARTGDSRLLIDLDSRLLIDLEEDKAAKAVIWGLLGEREQG